MHLPCSSILLLPLASSGVLWHQPPRSPPPAHLLACSEGGIWATLFGLLLWDVLFMPVPDVFRTPFQVGNTGYAAGSHSSKLPKSRGASLVNGARYAACEQTMQPWRTVGALLAQP